MKTLSLKKNYHKPSYTATYLPIFLRNDENTMKNAPSLEKNLPLKLPLWPQISLSVGGNLPLWKNLRLTGLGVMERS